MRDATAEPSSPPRAPARRRALLRRWVGFTLAAGLLAGAVWAAAAHGSALPDLWERLGAGDRRAWLSLPALALCVLASWHLTSWSFLAGTRPCARVGIGEMHALIGAAWLLNYLPLRPGLIGRVAYHKAVHGIAVHDSARIVLVQIAAGGAAAGVLALLLAASRVLGTGAAGPVLATAGLAAGLIAASAWGRRRERRWWPIPLVLALKLGDMWLWTFRYGLLFTLVDVPIRAEGALAVAVVSQFASLIPLSGNGLGLREWAVGLCADSLPAGWASAAGGAMQAAGLSADLVNRAVEVAIAVPVGLASVAWLGRRGPARASARAASPG